ncbi:MAG: hypothetical protein ACTHKL_15320, partial [Streptosporangiaceae bacterium]
IFSTLDPRVLQYKPGLLMTPELCEELLDRTEAGIGRANAEVKGRPRSSRRASTAGGSGGSSPRAGKAGARR